MRTILDLKVGGRARRARKLVGSTRAGYLWPLVVVLVGIALVGSDVNQVLANSSQQDQLRQQNALETSSYLSGIDYTLPGQVALIADSALTGAFNRGYLNNKRARKMSAFVPMRGRKDGRDSTGIVPGSEQLPLFLSAAGDSDNEINVLRLVAANGGLEGPASVTSGAGWASTTPRQFANQMSARHLAGSESASASDELTGLLQAPLMQAKLRRAFHPMRGKRLMDISAEELQQEF